MSSLSHCQFVIKTEFHFSSEIKGITLVVSIFKGSKSHFIPVYSPLIFFLQVLIIQSVQLLSGVWFFVTPWSQQARTAARQASLSITNSQTLLKLMSIESVMPSNHLILCRPLLLSRLHSPSAVILEAKKIVCHCFHCLFFMEWWDQMPWS